LDILYGVATALTCLHKEDIGEPIIFTQKDGTFGVVPEMQCKAIMAVYLYSSYHNVGFGFGRKLVFLFA
jgi:hypothetical protein